MNSGLGKVRNYELLTRTKSHLADELLADLDGTLNR